MPFSHLRKNQRFAVSQVWAKRDPPPRTFRAYSCQTIITGGPPSHSRRGDIYSKVDLGRMAAEKGAVRAEYAPSYVRPCAITLIAICLLLLLPALALAYAGTGWLDLKPPPLYSAAALLIGPLPFASGAFFAWKAARELRRAQLLKAIAALSLSLPVYTVVWAWGGRMLI